MSFGIQHYAEQVRGLLRKFSSLIEGSNMIFHTLTFAGPEGSVENRGRSPRFSTFPRDLANNSV